MKHLLIAAFALAPFGFAAANQTISPDKRQADTVLPMHPAGKVPILGMPKNGTNQVPSEPNRSTQTYVIKQVDAGEDRLEIIDPALPANATLTERQRYLSEVLFPKVEADAAAGLEPAVWEIGFFYQNGWGVPEDLAKAEVAFRIGLQHKQGHGPWRLGWIFYDKASSPQTAKEDVEKYLAKSEELYRAALAVGFKRAAPQASYLARRYMTGDFSGIKPDLVKAQLLLDVIGVVAPSHPRYLLSLAMLRSKQERYAEAFDAATSVLPRQKQSAKGDKEDSEYVLAATTQCVAADHIGKIAEVNPEELLVLLNGGMVRVASSTVPLLEAIEKAALDHPRYLELPRYFRLMGDLRSAQKRPAEAFDFYWRSLPGLKQQALTDHDPEEYEHARLQMLFSGMSSGALFKLKPDEFMELMPKLPPRISWLILFGMVPELAALVFWTHRTRLRGPGLVLSAAWIIATMCAGGIGFFLPFPGLNNAAGHWIGALMSALACFIAVRVSGRERYFGTGPIFPSLKAILRSAGFLVATLVGVILYGLGYQFLSDHLFGQKPETQFVEFLLRWDTTVEFLVTFLVACIAIPFYEEVCFRGFLFESLLRRWGVGWALGLSSLIFALVHGKAAPQLLFLAVALGWLRLRCGDLRLSILLHFLNNSMAIVALHFFKQ